MKSDARQAKALDTFRQAGGVLRTSDVLGTGIHPRDLYRLRDGGLLEQISRGVFRLASLPPLSDPDLVTVAARVPKAVITLVSALYFHGLTLEVPHEVSIALPRGSAQPRLDWPPVKVYRYSGAAFTTGIEEHVVDGVTIRVYAADKTVADCFRFRNQLGTDVAVEALRQGLEEKRFSIAELMRVAKVLRVHEVIRPYLEALQ